MTSTPPATDFTTAEREAVSQIAAALHGANRVLFITGAGLSADSGLPTYRGIGGLYSDGLTADGVPIETALSGGMLRRDPALTWRYVHQIEAACRGARHNRGHELIAAFERDLAADVHVLTQNVDGFHRDAGSEAVIDIHGDLKWLLCTDRRCGERWHVPDYSEVPALPSCRQCGTVARPDVVLFGEMLPTDKVATLEREHLRGFDVVLSIGTTSVFPYIAGPVWQSARRGMPSLEINPGESRVSDVVSHRLQRGATEALEALWSATQQAG